MFQKCSRQKKLVSLVIILLLAGIAYFILRKTANTFNVILISLDTLRQDHVGFYGYHRDTTPNLDKLAKQSIVFQNTFAQSPNTIVSHATMLTSLYPAAHKVNPKSALPDSVKTLAEYFQEAGFNTAGYTTHEAWLNRKMGFAQGFNDFFAISTNAQQLNLIAKNFLKKNGSRNFFLFLHYYDIHSDYHKLPYDTESEFDHKFCKESAGKFSGCFQNVCASQYLAKINREGLTISPEFKEYAKALYDGGIAYTDHHINQLLIYLKKEGLFDNTLIIITSDHGEEFMEHGKMLHDQLFSETTKVPLIIKLPHSNVHKRIHEFSGIIDIMPTILDIAGIPCRNGSGRSLLPLIRGRKIKDQTVYATLYGSENEDQTAYFLRNPKYGFHLYHNQTLQQLFDLVQDPSETEDISHRERFFANMFKKRIIAHYKKQQQYREHHRLKNRKIQPTKKDIEKLKNLGYID